MDLLEAKRLPLNEDKLPLESKAGNELEELGRVVGSCILGWINGYEGDPRRLKWQLEQTKKVSWSLVSIVLELLNWSRNREEGRYGEFIDEEKLEEKLLEKLQLKVKSPLELELEKEKNETEELLQRISDLRSKNKQDRRVQNPMLNGRNLPIFNALTRSF